LAHGKLSPMNERDSHSCRRNQMARLFSSKHHFLWNVGYFADAISQGQTFSTYSSKRSRDSRISHSERVGRAAPGRGLAFCKTVDNKLRLRARPESFLHHIFSIPAHRSGLDPYSGPMNLLPPDGWLFVVNIVGRCLVEDHADSVFQVATRL